MIRYIILILCCLAFYSCEKNNNTTTEEKKSSEEITKSDTINPTRENNTTRVKLKSHSKFTLNDFYKDNTELDSLTELVFNSMSDNDRIAQMIITSAGNNGKSDDQVLNLIKNKKVGGVVFLGGSKDRFTNLIKSFKETAEKVKSLPLLFSTDAEPSLINMKISGLKQFPATNTIKDIGTCSKTTNDLSKTLNEIGFNQNYAPVCDNNVNREIIGDRSFGNDPEVIEKLSTVFIQESQKNNILATAKHFPGHGFVKGDSHKSLVYIDGQLKELDVYKALIEHSPLISIMVGHIAVRNNKEYDTDGYPATLCRKIVTDLLKREMKFKGIVITDAMNMGALSTFPSPSFKAVDAGCDMILMPTDENQLISTILTKLRTDDKFKSQVYESIKKIIKVKLCLGLM
ncbi:hypothetical protein BH10BAC5_BH10BAC5_25650 [soil metagenome]